MWRRLGSSLWVSRRAATPHDVPQDSADSLTGLPDRSKFEVRLGAEAARVRDRGGKLAVCLLDLDCLRQINHQFGRDAGDEVLCAISQLLWEINDRADVYRVGGDEFAIIFAGQDSAGARSAMRTFARAAWSDEGCRRIGLSWGVAATSGGDASSLIASAQRQLDGFKRSRARRPLSRLRPEAAAA
jgi:diguanylate cyclase (GGDEF)-like protein